MDLAMWVYVAETLSVGDGKEVLAFFSIIVAIIFKIFAETEKQYQTRANATLAVAVVLCLWALFVPSRQGMYTIMAAHGIDQAVQSEEVQRFAGKSLQVLEKRMDEYLQE